jgi:hypothetical protein
VERNVLITTGARDDLACVIRSCKEKRLKKSEIEVHGDANPACMPREGHPTGEVTSGPTTCVGIQEEEIERRNPQHREKSKEENGTRQWYCQVVGLLIT